MLFGFLDIFDKKITVALTSYLLLGLFAKKYIGEMQLEKFIEEAQVAGDTDRSIAQNRWKAAIQEAQFLDKPPSMQAELRRSLADSYCNWQSKNDNPDSADNNTSEEAISELKNSMEII